jgi:hypothetical protein
MAVALQVASDSGQNRIVGVRGSRGGMPAPDAAAIGRQIGQLGSDKFEEREGASRELAALGQRARQALTRASTSRDAEVRTRARRLLQALTSQDKTWYLSAHDAPPNLTQRCSIAGADGQTFVVNERGERSRATTSIDRDHIEVNALDWQLKGRVEMDREGTRIQWANGTKWTQKRP